MDASLCMRVSCSVQARSVRVVAVDTLACAEDLVAGCYALEVVADDAGVDSD